MRKNSSSAEIRLWIGFLTVAFMLVSRSVWAAPAPFKLILGYAALNARISPLWLADEQGYLAKYGLQVEQVYLRGAPTLVAGLASGDIQLGRSGGSATLAAIGAGHDFKIVATFSSRNTYDFIARPNIKRAEELRGKKIGLTSIGGTTWMGVLLWLEHFGLDPQRDNILLQVLGDQNIQAQAVEAGIADAAALDGVWSKKLKQKGFTILGEYSDLNQRIVGQAMVVPHVKGVDRKPFPSLDGLRNVQRMLKMRTPKIGEIKAEEVIDSLIMRKLDRTFAAEGASFR